ncbi:MAG: hypothetical protein U1F43_23670 [Myxococcota bacterium]
MASVKERLLDPQIRPLVVRDCCALIDQAVKSTKGFSGIAVKGAYQAVKAIKPRFVEGVVDALLDDWVGKLELFEKEHEGKPGTLGDYLIEQRVRVSESLISVTDERAETTKHKTAAKFYHRLRPSALTHTEQAVPELARLVTTYGAADFKPPAAAANP